MVRAILEGKQFSGKYSNPNKRWRKRHSSRKHLLNAHKERIERHVDHVKLFTGVLKALGADVDEHAKKLKIEDDYLKELADELGEEEFLSDADKKKLKEALENIAQSSTRIIVLERELWDKVKIPIQTALNHAYFKQASVQSVKAMTLFSPRDADEKQRKLEADMPKLRKLLHYSFDLENEIFAKEYPKLLDTIEEACEKLVDVEKGLDSKSKSRKIFSRVHKDLRHIFHEDTFELSKDIDKMYQFRLDLLEHMMEASREFGFDILKDLEKDLKYVTEIKEHYRTAIDIHEIKLNNLYEKLGGRAR